MPEIIECPRCSRRLNLTEEHFGRQVQCPACTTTFTAQRPGPPPLLQAAPYPPPAGPRAWDRPAGPPAWERPAEPILDEFPDDPIDEGQWRKVRTGITMIILGILGVAFALIIVLFSTLGRVRAEGNEVDVLATVVGSLAFVGLTITGSAFCLAAPDRHGARGLALTGLVLLIAYVLAAFLGGVLSGFRAAGGVRPGPAEHIHLLLALILGIAWVTVLLLYARAVALCLRRSGLATSIVCLIGLEGLLACSSLVAVSMVDGRGLWPGDLQFLFSCGTLILGIGFAVWFLFTLSAVRNAITARLGEGPRSF